MDSRSLRLLEYDKVRALLAARTRTARGHERAEALLPSSEPLWIEDRLDLTAQARGFLLAEGTFGLGGISDLRPHLGRAVRGGLLAGEELWRVSETLLVLQRLHQQLASEAIRARWPGIFGINAQIVVPPALTTQLRRCVEEGGRIADAASTELAGIRARIRVVEGRVKERLESYLRQPELLRLLQDPILTQRGGRWVLPVRQEFKAQVRGIIHDQSQSGATVFIEPMAIVELDNELRELAIQEEREIERVLRRLTDLVAQDAPSLDLSLAAAAELDLLQAQAELAEAMRAVQPELLRAPGLRLEEARHPLLAQAVPMSLTLFGQQRGLIITGPNTGGKTVTMKTVGLLALMAQSGLHVPAAQGSGLFPYRGVYADIGDEQSLEQSLSTFSSHMSAIVGMLSQDLDGTLILLDEIGAGTDPTEGAALARAILERLLERGAVVLATTHYSELKELAFEQGAFLNAAVEFDVATLRPTYRLLIGTPGRSNALAIAARLGLPEDLVQRTQSLLSGEAIHREELITRMEASRRSLLDELDQTRGERAQVQHLRRELEAAIEQQRLQADKAIAQARSQAQSLVHDARRELREAIRLAKLGDTSTAEKMLTRVQQSLEQPKEEEVPALFAAAAPAAGDNVRIFSLGQTGRLLEGPDAHGQVLVEIGSMRLRLRSDDIQKTGSEQSAAKRQRRWVAVTVGLGEALRPELDLRGLQAHEAITRLDKYLDDVRLSGLHEVRIIHGKGTGSLRHAVAEFLQTVPQIEGFRLGVHGEGGDGVTVVTLD